MAKAPSKKQNNRANPLSKKDGKKDAKEGQSSKDPKQSHLCKYSPPQQMTVPFASPSIFGFKVHVVEESMYLHTEPHSSRPSYF